MGAREHVLPGASACRTLLWWAQVGSMPSLLFSGTKSPPARSVLRTTGRGSQHGQAAGCASYRTGPRGPPARCQGQPGRRAGPGRGGGGCTCRKQPGGMWQVTGTEIQQVAVCAGTSVWKSYNILFHCHQYSCKSNQRTRLMLKLGAYQV